MATADTAPIAEAKPEAKPKPSRAAAWAKWGKKNYLPLALVTAFVLGLLAAPVAAAIDNVMVGEYRVFQSLAVIYIFLLQGGNLKVDDVKKAFYAYVGITVGVVSILFLTPLAAFLVKPMSFLSQDLRTGFTLFLCMPTTINSGVALVGAAKGSVPVALLMTVLSNSIGVLTVPFYLRVMLESTVDIKLNPLPMLAKLAVTILIPVAVGMAARIKIQRVADFLKTYKEPLGLSAHTALASIPFLKVGSNRAQILSLGFGQFVVVVLTALVLHTLLMVVLFGLTAPFPKKTIPEPVRKAIVILGSEKTLPVSMAVLAFLPPELGAKGLIAVPCILGHLSQLLMDAVVASKWAERTPDDDEKPAEKPKEAEKLAEAATEETTSPAALEAGLSSEEEPAAATTERVALADSRV